MKYCTHCGAQLNDDDMYCPSCGTAVATSAGNPYSSTSDSEPWSFGVNDQQGQSGVETAAEVFMVISCVICAFSLIALAWNIPMTVHVFRCVKRHKRIGIAFKICTLIFVSIIGGILLFCRNEHGKI
ncbi:MAG: zinc-ribbon domain-containing protein [Coprobacillus sp.]|nr:zinc-ribbon domain-containing protein [Coprobacillus sp.]